MAHGQMGHGEQETIELIPDLDTRRRRALYRASHRGTKEMDLLMGPFAEARLQHMDETLLLCFERLLAEEDPDIQSWIFSERALAGQDLGPRVPLKAEFAELIGALKSFHGLH